MRPARLRVVSAPPAHEDPARRLAGRKRLAYLDDLKVGLVATIVAGHAVIGYTTGDRTYQEIQETRVAPALETVFTFLMVPAVLFVMGMFFLLAGLLTPGRWTARARGASPATGCYALACRGRRSRWCCGR
jgi:hypothetical protein